MCGRERRGCPMGCTEGKASPREDAGVPSTALRGVEGRDVLGRASSTGTALGWHSYVELLRTGRKLAGVTRMVLRVRRQGESDSGQVAGGPEPAH